MVLPRSGSGNGFRQSFSRLSSTPSRPAGTLTSKNPGRFSAKWEESPTINARNSRSAAGESGSANSITNVGPDMLGA